MCQQTTDRKLEIWVSNTNVSSVTERVVCGQIAFTLITRKQQEIGKSINKPSVGSRDQATKIVFSNRGISVAFKQNFR